MSGSVVAAPAAVAAPTPLTVTTTADAPVDGACADGDGAHLSLREALCRAQTEADAAVTVPAGTITLTNGALPYAPTQPGRRLTVTGAGAGLTTITAGGASRVLDLDPLLVGDVDVTVSGVTLAGGRPVASDGWFGGGAVVAGSGDATLPSALTLTDCRVTGSTNLPAGSTAQGEPGGAVQMSGGALTVRRCMFDANTATGATGGAIAFVPTSPADRVVVEQSTFTGNSSTGTAGVGVVGGGALVVQGTSTPQVTITGSTFTGNSATSASAVPALGSAVLVEAGTVTVRGSTVTGNTVTGAAGSRGALVLPAGQVTTSRLAGNTSVVGGLVTPDAVRGPVLAGGNWWGCVDPGTGVGCDTAPEAVTRAPFARLGVTAAPTVAVAGDAVQVTGTVTMSDGSAVPAELAAVLAPVPVTWSTTGGSVTPLTGVLGTLTQTSLVVGGPGDPVVTARVDGSAATTTVQVAEPATFLAQPSDRAVAEGGSATFDVVTTGRPAPTVQWSTAAPGSSTWTPVPGATGPSLEVSAVTRAADGTRYRATATNGFGAAAVSTPATLTVAWGPEVTDAPDDVTVLAGDDATFVAQATGSPAPTLTWQTSTDGTAWTPVAGATGPTWTRTTTAADDGLLVRAVATGASGAVPTTAARLTVQHGPQLGQPVDRTVADGDPVTFTVTPTGTPTPTVQWERLVDGAWVAAGAPGASLTLTADPTLHGARFRAAATSTLLSGPRTTTTAPVTLSVLHGPFVDTSPLSVTALAGGTATFTAASHGYPTPSVAWQTSPDGLTWTPVAGATATTYSRTVVPGDDQLLVRAVFAGHGTAATGSARLTVHTPPTVLTDPADTTVATGTDATFTVTVSGTPTPAVTWERRLPGGAWTTVAGAAGSTLTVPTDATLDGAAFRAVASATLVDGPASVSSAAATLHVLHGPVVDTSPVSVTVAAGTPTTFTAAAHGNPTPTVVWQTSADGGTTWQTVAGATSTTLTLAPARADDGLLVRARFTGHGVTDTAAATLTVQDGPVVTAQPAATTADVGTTATFTVAVDGLPAPTVQWQRRTDGAWSDVAGATGTTLSVTATDALHGTAYRAVATNPAGTATSDPATLTVLLPPTVSDPSSVVTRPGEDVELTVTTTGRPAPAVTWEASPDGVAWTPVPGATGPTLTLTPDDADDGLAVRAVASSTLAAGPAEVRSAPATVTVVPEPVQVSGPPAGTPVAAVAGSATTVDVVALGAGLTGRWEVSRDGGTSWAPVGAGFSTSTVTGVAAVHALRAAAAPVTRTGFRATFTPTLADDGILLRVVVVDAAGETALTPVTVRVAAPAAPAPTATSGTTGSAARAGAAGAVARAARLSSTGATVGPLVGAAAVLVLLGTLTVVVVRRRRA